MNLIEKAERFRKAIDSNLKVAQKSVNPEELSAEELKDIVFIYDKYEMGVNYKSGKYVEQHGELYKCNKDHVSDYENMPNLDDGTYWTKVNGQGEEIVEEDIEFYSNDKTYNPGDKVKYYGAVYKSKVRQSGKNPEAYPDNWEKL